MPPSCHILLIEDEPLVAVGIAMILEEAGATSIDMAATEREAIEMAHARRPDVIVSDVQLAQGGLGPAAVAAICERHGQVPTIYVTGNPDLCPSVLSRQERLAILSKPFRETELLRALARVQD